MLRKPTYDTSEYNCLSQDLKVVDYWLSIYDIQTKIDEAKKEKEILLSSDGKLVADLYQQVISRATADRPANPAKSLEGAVARLVAATRFPMTSRFEIDSLHQAIVAIYSKVDIDALAKDWKAVFGDGSTAEKVAHIDRRVGGLTKKLNQVRETLPTCFVGGYLPEKWRNVRLREPVPQDQREALGTTIVTNFVADWRNRSMMFSMPVTIYGTAIASLGEERAKTWMDAYKLLGLDKLPKNPFYAPVISKERTQERQAAKV